MAYEDILRTFLAAMDSEKVHPYPDVRQLLGALTKVAQFETGSIASMTGAATEVEVNGNPRIVILYDLTQTTPVIITDTMPADSYVNLATGVQVVADGLTLGANKFTIGVDADINTALDEVHYLVII